jgi:hypothetical protein
LNTAAPEFWTRVGEIELDFFDAVSQRRLAEEGPSLANRFGHLYQQVRGGSEWASVFDTGDFVMSNYFTRASKAEAAAVRSLRAKLEALAGRVAPEAEAATAEAEPVPPQRRRAAAKKGRRAARKKSARPARRRQTGSATKARKHED